MNQSLKLAADALETASKELEDFRENLEAVAPEDMLPPVADIAFTRMVGVVSRLIESVGLLGEHVSLLTATMTNAGAVLSGQVLITSHQCPECGLPIGTNASSDDDNNPCGCRTCTLALKQHHASVGSKCSDCGCLAGTNGENCRRCLDEAYFQRHDASQGPKHA